MANDYPLPGFHFMVEWGGTNVGFSEVTGLNIEAQVIEYRHGAMKLYTPIKMPGLRKYSNISLKRGILPKDNDLFQWFNTINLNQVERRNIVISLLNENHEPVIAWKVMNAWPVKITGPGLKADSNEVAIECIELAHEGLTIEHP